MTSPSRARGRAGAASPASQFDAKSGRATPPSPQPLKPRRKLFIGLMIAFALWVAGLLAMYFTTIYPNRHRSLPNDEQLDLR